MYLVKIILLTKFFEKVNIFYLLFVAELFAPIFLPVYIREMFLLQIMLCYVVSSFNVIQLLDGLVPNWLQLHLISTSSVFYLFLVQFCFVFDIFSTHAYPLTYVITTIHLFQHTSKYAADFMRDNGINWV